MSKPSLQDVDVTIGGRSFRLRYSIKATLALRDKWGLGSDREVQARMSKPTMSDFVDIFWAGLRTHHPEVTPDDVLTLLDDAGAEGMASAVTQALSAASPPEEPRPDAGQA